MEPPEPRESAAASRRALHLLVALMVVSFGVRAWSSSQRLSLRPYFDERFPLKNAVVLARDGDLHPRSAYYLSLSYLPQAAVLAASQGLHRLTGVQALAMFREERPDRITPAALLLCRGLNAAFGTLSLLLVFLLGRRLDSPETGLLAAALLAAFPKHIQASALFKPDILVLLLTLIVFQWALAAAVRPRLSRFLLAGMGVGLAVSAKYTGIAAALPVTAAALVGGWRDPRQWGRLVLAGAASVATFVVLNPFLGTVLRFVPHLTRGYATRGRLDGSSHWIVFLRQMDFLLAHHGWLVALFAALGAAGLLWRIARPAPEDSRERRIGSILLLSLLLGYSVLHAAGLTLFRSQNYLPVVPFSSLAAAWMMVGTWRALTGRMAGLRRRPVGIAVWSLAGLALIGRQGAVLYPQAVPSTQQVAGRLLAERLDSVRLRTVVFEGSNGWPPLALAEGRPLRLVVGRLDRLTPDLLDRADAEIFPAARLDGPAQGFYRLRAGRLLDEQVLLVAPRLFQSRGEPVAVLLHPWRLDASFPSVPFHRSAPEGFPYASLPDGLRPGDVISLVLWVPLQARPIEELRIQPGRDRVPLVRTATRRGVVRMVTRRLPLREGAERIELPRQGGRSLRPYRLEVYRWTAPSPAASAEPPEIRASSR